MSIQMRSLLSSASAAAAALVVTPARADWGLLNMPRGVTDLSGEIYGLHMLILWICVAIGAVVFGAMIYSLVKYRKSQGAVPDTSILHSDKVEFIWTIIPVFILVAMAVPAARTLLKIEDMTGSQLTVKVSVLIAELRVSASGETVLGVTVMIGHTRKLPLQAPEQLG